MLDYTASRYEFDGLRNIIDVDRIKHDLDEKVTIQVFFNKFYV